MTITMVASIAEARDPIDAVRILRTHGIRTRHDRAIADIAHATQMSIRLVLIGAILAGVSAVALVIWAAAHEYDESRSFPWPLLVTTLGFAIMLTAPVAHLRIMGRKRAREAAEEVLPEPDLRAGLDAVGGFGALPVALIWPHQGRLVELGPFAHAYLDALAGRLTSAQVDVFVQLARDGYTGTFDELVATSRTLA